jgi:pyruvate dehydrogenase E1 component
VPNLIAYDPAYAYEIAVILQDGIRRMYEAQEDVFYYITLGNEPYRMPPMPEGAAEGILKGMYKLRPGTRKPGCPQVQLFGSGTILREALRAQALLEERFGVCADVWSVTSYKELRRDALAAERWNMLHPAKRARKPYVTRMLEKEEGPVVAASDYMKAMPDMIAPWVPGGVQALGTDGFGRSDTREALRRHFEVDAESIAVAALHALQKRGQMKKDRIEEAIQVLGIDPEKPDPVES